jgi:hypothetical protein
VTRRPLLSRGDEPSHGRSLRCPGATPPLPANASAPRTEAFEQPQVRDRDDGGECLAASPDDHALLAVAHAIQDVGELPARFARGQGPARRIVQTASDADLRAARALLDELGQRGALGRRAHEAADAVRQFLAGAEAVPLSTGSGKLLARAIHTARHPGEPTPVVYCLAPVAAGS